ncbi:MAG: response regulator [Bacteroidia bacterium]|nr:response regulator [Bacteroidia bacterium]
MKTPSIYIVEDEALIADHIAHCLRENGYQIAGISASAGEALIEIEKKQPDLILLDIQLQGALDGIDLAHQLRHTFSIPYIFLTSNSDTRTLERLKLTEPAGYISKPYQARDLASNISIALYKSTRQEPKTTPRPEQEDFFFIKDKHALVKVHFPEILFAEAMDNYTRLVTADKKHVLSSTLKTVGEKLEGHGFIRTHRSYLVNLKLVDQILPRSVWVKGHEIPLTESARKQLMDLISTL